MPLPAVNPVAFRDAFQRHHAFVSRALRRFGVSTEQLDDAVQEVFVVLHRRWHEIDPGAEVRPWLWGVARRVASDERRGAARRERMHESAASLLLPPHHGPDVKLLHRERLLWLDATLARLPDEQLDAFLLCDVEGMTAPEVGRVLGVPTGTVYSRLRQARLVVEQAHRRWCQQEQVREACR